MAEKLLARLRIPLFADVSVVKISGMIGLPHGSLDFGRRRPLVMGILNVTPDSFSDGGQFYAPEAAIGRAEEMIRAGADILDVGPESTRPGAQPVEAQEQIRRAAPVIEGIRQAHPQVAISIDTRLASVAEAGLDAGADLVNDVSALRNDAALALVVARRGAAVVLMHMQGRPATMQDQPT